MFCSVDAIFLNVYEWENISHEIMKGKYKIKYNFLVTIGAIYQINEDMVSF